ncbi:MAG: GDSL family lipase [Nocardioides sp.]|nr:GDSL family lipase [Nocardioides sp.]
MTRRARTALAATTAAALLALAGCGADEPPPEAALPAPGDTATPAPATTGAPDPSDAPEDGLLPSYGGDEGGPSYVALGDSYAAAPGVPTTEFARGCLRSDRDYAHVLAADQGLALTDVSCSGAATQDVVDLQLPFVGADTELVTVTIGGNDFDLFSTVLRGCLGQAGQPGAPCTEATSADVEAALPQIGDAVGTLLDHVVAAAPDARVVVVGYPDLLPEQGSCPDLVPIADGDYPYVDALTEELSALLRTAADDRDLDFVDVHAASQGHDVCSDDPWVNGQETAEDGTIPFHPFASEQAAVAALVADLL